MKPRLYLCLMAACVLAAPVHAADTPAVSAISREPFYAGIVSRAGDLKAESERLAALPDARTGGDFQTFAAAVTTLSADDLKGHYDLRARGTDNDLKCILMGVSRDLPLKLDAIRKAQPGDELKAAFAGLTQDLSDNVDVIVTPATTDSGLDCVIEFGKGA